MSLELWVCMWQYLLALAFKNHFIYKLLTKIQVICLLTIDITHDGTGYLCSTTAVGRQTYMKCCKNRQKLHDDDTQKLQTAKTTANGGGQVLIS